MRKTARAIFMLLSIALNFQFVNGDDGLPTTYLLYVPSFTMTALNTAKSYGYATNVQPSKITWWLLAVNTNYMEISYSTGTAAENTAVLSLIVQGKIKAERRIEFKNDSSGGNYIKVVDCINDPVNFVCRPYDWDKNWATWVSSP